ncbi:uncharacterized protein [Argopecten irradians]|uniref:uncharacterized protein n=1 Tax=Argopecten irradians TaxID=31199 RepID=UPI003723775F
MVGHMVYKMDVDGAVILNAETEKEDKGKEEAVDMLERLAKDYSTYLEIDASKEKNKFGETIEDMLTKLDEFGSLVDMCCTDVNFISLNNNLLFPFEQKRSQTKDNRAVSFTRPKIYQTEEYFPKKSPQTDGQRETTDDAKPDKSVNPEMSAVS